MPNSVTSIYQSSLKVLMGELHIEAPLLRQVFAVLQLKNAVTAFKPLLHQEGRRQVPCPGLPKECDSRGVIGASSRIIIDLEGFLQVAWHKDGADNENKDSNQKDNPREFAVIQ